MQNKNIVMAGLAVLALLFIGYLVETGNHRVAGVNPTGPQHYQMEPFLQGLTAGTGNQFVLSNVGALTTSAAATLGGFVTFDAGSMQSYPNSTSTTVTSETMIASDIQNYSTVLMTPNTGSVTLTLPATSTLSSTFLPTAGDMTQQCWYNATTTANIKTTFAAGAGFDLEVASSTSGVQGAINTNLSINAGNSGCFRFIRKANTDIVAQFQSFVDGD